MDTQHADERYIRVQLVGGGHREPETSRALPSRKELRVERLLNPPLGMR
jgi:hypothetical protein